jgi:glycosyltransferase involved in cell wall biosynthesis
MKKQRLRILQLVSSLTVGGAEQVVLSLAERVDRRRFETHVCSLSVIGQNGLQPQFEQLDLPLLTLNARRLYDLPTIRQVRRYVQEQQIDLIHTHLLNADIIGRFIGHSLGIPVISTLQNIPDNHARQRADRYWLERLTARYLATHLVTVSRQLQAMYMRQWHIPESRLSVIYNTVRMEPFLAVPTGVPEERPYPGPIITNVARLNPQKAQHLLLEAAQIVLHQFPQAHFLIVGKGHLEQELKQRAQALGLERHVTFTGVRHDIPAILAESDIFVLSSQWEGLPLSAVEAMAAARPVVVTNVGGNTELVEHGRSGLVVPPNNIEALADGLLTMLQDRSTRITLGAAARQRVQHLFSTDRFIQQYESLYTALGYALPFDEAMFLDTQEVPL